MSLSATGFYRTPKIGYDRKTWTGMPFYYFCYGAAVSEVPDHWSHHLADTLAAGRGLCDERLARLLCEEGPDCIAEIVVSQIGWMRSCSRPSEFHGLSGLVSSGEACIYNIGK